MSKGRWYSSWKDKFIGGPIGPNVMTYRAIYKELDWFKEHGLISSKVSKGFFGLKGSSYSLTMFEGVSDPIIMIRSEQAISMEMLGQIVGEINLVVRSFKLLETYYMMVLTGLIHFEKGMRKWVTIGKFKDTTHLLDMLVSSDRGLLVDIDFESDKLCLVSRKRIVSGPYSLDNDYGVNRYLYEKGEVKILMCKFQRVNMSSGSRFV